MRHLVTQYVAVCDIAYMYICGGNRQACLDWLERAFARHDPDLPYLRIPINDPLRLESRFQAIVERMKFLPA